MTVPRANQHDVTVRRGRASDAQRLEVLAALDSAPKLQGDVILAEIGDRIVAAMALDGGRAIADPFVRAAAFVQLLEFRAQQLRSATSCRGPNLTDRLGALFKRMAPRVN